MTDVSGIPNPVDWMWWLNKPKSAAAAPGAGLVQPILPGWNFGNVIVNEANSNAPDTEQRIVAEKSYGQQIGVLLDAISALAKDPGRKEPATRKALAALDDLDTAVNRIKADAAKTRIDRIESDLDTLRGKTDPAEYDEAAARLRTYLDEHAPRAAAEK